MIGKLKNGILFLGGLIFKILPVDNKKIFITNFYGKGYGDNLKPIVEEILKRHSDYKIYWSLKNMNEQMPDAIKKVKYHSFKELYHLSTSKIWIDNNRKFRNAVKKKEQFYIQTWHGGLGLKKIEGAALDGLPNNYAEFGKRDSNKTDVMISNSNYRTNQYRNFFWYNGPILEIGSPRNDIFFKDNKELKKKIRSNLNLSDNDYVILYVPTFRKYNFDYFSIDFNKLINEFKKKYHKSCKVLFRAHPSLNIDVLNENLIDVSKYPDVEELLLISDMLISDYSSVLFDFIYTKNDIYLYAPDYENYITDRGFNFDYDSLPFSKAYDSDELINNILSNNAKKYNEQLKKFMKSLKIYDDGNSSKRIVTLIEKVIKGEKINYEKI